MSVLFGPHEGCDRHSDCALLCAVHVELERANGHEADAAWALLERMQSDELLVSALIDHIQPLVIDATVTLELAGRAIEATESIEDAARALTELTDARENPEAARRALDEQLTIIASGLREIVGAVASASRRRASCRVARGDAAINRSAVHKDG